MQKGPIMKRYYIDPERWSRVGQAASTNYGEELATALKHVIDVIERSEADKYSDSPNSPYGHCPVSADTRNDLVELATYALECLNVEVILR